MKREQSLSIMDEMAEIIEECSNGWNVKQSEQMKMKTPNRFCWLILFNLLLVSASFTNAFLYKCFPLQLLQIISCKCWFDQKSWRWTKMKNIFQWTSSLYGWLSVEQLESGHNRHFIDSMLILSNSIPHFLQLYRACHLEICLNFDYCERNKKLFC